MDEKKVMKLDDADPDKVTGGAFDFAHVGSDESVTRYTDCSIWPSAQTSDYCRSAGWRCYKTLECPVAAKSMGYA